MKYLFSIVIAFFSLYHLSAQGVRGVVYDTAGNPLPFATIYVEETESGTSANQEAYYELQLKPGNYTIQYKFVGYETLIEKVNVTAGDLQQLDVKLSQQSILLDEVSTYAKATDPANWMMRKAIAKSSYHRQQIDAYSARVYVKGKGKVLEIPFLLERRLEKEGIEENTMIISETVSEIKYKRPNQFSEKVISIYASKKTDFNANPMRFIAGSFYQDEIGSVISPLSSKAFRYYRFSHEGAFLDEGHLINIIKVMPKVKGPNVFEGEIQLVEDDWALYSLDLEAQIELGIDVRIRQVYQNINDLAWMPITHQFDVEGKVMGVGFEGKYLASVSDYKIKLNPALPKNIEILDDNEIEANEQESSTVIKASEELEKEISKDEVAVVTDELASIMEDYQKSQSDSLAKQDIIGVYDFSIDSGAYTQDSMFWAQIRPIPLSQDENRGYVKLDSLNLIQEEKAREDSIKEVNTSTFQPLDIIIGGRYYLDSSKFWQFKIYQTLLNTNYNTVEGINVDYSLGIKRYLKVNPNPESSIDPSDIIYNRRPYILLKPTARYSVARDKVIGKVLAKYQFQDGDISLRGGRYVAQFYDESAITPLINTSFTAIWEQNFMKLYEKDFVEIDYEKRFSPKWFLNANLEYEKRNRLRDQADFHLIEWRRNFTPNYPVNVDPIADFDGQEAINAKVKLEYKPFIKYVLRNGKLRPVVTKNSTFLLTYFKGIPIGPSEVNYDRLEVGYRDEFDFGAKGRSYLSAKAGAFLNNNALGFMDYAHFEGNRSFITQADPVETFRLLDYYLYSTDQYYFQNFLFHRFRKLLVTQFTSTRLLGLKEGAFFNYLYTPDSNHYAELGYSIEGLLRFFRIEVATQYEDFQYKGFGVRIGVSTTIGGNVSLNISDDE